MNTSRNSTSRPTMQQTVLDFAPRSTLTPIDPEAIDLVSPFVRLASALEASREPAARVHYYLSAAHRVAARIQTIRAGLAAGQDVAAIPGLDPHLAAMLSDLLRTGRLERLERLEREIRPVDRLTVVDGIGPTMAARLVGAGIEDLVALEQAVHDGRLDRIQGFGAQRVDQVRLWLEARRRQRPGVPPKRLLTVPELLEVDAMFRSLPAQQSQRRALRPAASDSSEPTVGSRGWTPMWRTEVAGWSIAATRDPSDDETVILHANRDSSHVRFVVQTEKYGSLAGMRIVRGREGASRRFHLDARVAA